MSTGFLLWWAVGIIAIGMIIREENDVKIWHAPIAVILGLFGPAALLAYICLYRVNFARVIFKKRVTDGTENTSK